MTERQFHEQVFAVSGKTSDADAPTKHSKSTGSEEPSPKINKFLWVELVARIHHDHLLRLDLKKNFDSINVSSDAMHRFKHLSSPIRNCIAEFGNQNCLRALSVLEDLTQIKKNQYKFMYERLTLASAVDLLINESSFLYKSLFKQKACTKHFLRLIRSWIDYVFLIHTVPENAHHELARQIVIRIGLMNNVNLTIDF